MANQYRLNEPEWDEALEAYSDYDDDESYDDDDEGILDSGLQAVGSLLSGNPIGAIKSVGSAIGSVLGVKTAPASTSNIQNRSNLSGQVQTAGGRQVPVRLPETIATKQDINVLQQAIQKINGEVKKVADTTTTNGVALTKLSKEVKTIDDKHVAVSKKQNELIGKLGKRVSRMQSQEQMNMMLSVLMQPKLESITFASKTGTPEIKEDGTAHAIADSKSTDNTLLFLMMGMMGGGDDEKGGGGGFGDMSNNPLMMILMMKALSGDGSFL